jgi:hypothetical protein
MGALPARAARRNFGLELPEHPASRRGVMVTVEPAVSVATYATRAARSRRPRPVLYLRALVAVALLAV